MLTTRHIQTGPGLTFDVSVAGADDGPLVLMLHGFGVSRFFWDAQIEALGNAGYRAVAPNQRGYAASARPDPADHAKYRIDLLIADAISIANTFAKAPTRFHLAGHDWGGSLSWHIADQYPDRLASLTTLSRPHPQAFNAAVACRTASRSADPATTVASSTRKPARTTSPGTPNGSARASPPTASPGTDRKTPVGHRQPAGHGGCPALAWYRAAASPTSR
jgi:pimeloyl-ACP methyl ester carboxylesterase